MGGALPDAEIDGAGTPVGDANDCGALDTDAATVGEGAGDDDTVVAFALNGGATPALFPDIHEAAGKLRDVGVNPSLIENPSGPPTDIAETGTAADALRLKGSADPTIALPLDGSATPALFPDIHEAAGKLREDLNPSLIETPFGPPTDIAEPGTPGAAAGVVALCPNRIEEEAPATTCKLLTKSPTRTAIAPRNPPP